MKRNYIITALLLASSAGLIGGDAPKKASHIKVSAATSKPRETEMRKVRQSMHDEQPQPTKKKGFKEMVPSDGGGDPNPPRVW